MCTYWLNLTSAHERTSNTVTAEAEQNVAAEVIRVVIHGGENTTLSITTNTVGCTSASHDSLHTAESGAIEADLLTHILQEESRGISTIINIGIECLGTNTRSSRNGSEGSDNSATTKVSRHIDIATYSSSSTSNVGSNAVVTIVEGDLFSEGLNGGHFFIPLTNKKISDGAGDF